MFCNPKPDLENLINPYVDRPCHAALHAPGYFMYPRKNFLHHGGLAMLVTQRCDLSSHTRCISLINFFCFPHSVILSTLITRHVECASFENDYRSFHVGFSQWFFTLSFHDGFSHCLFTMIFHNRFPTVVFHNGFCTMVYRESGVASFIQLMAGSWTHISQLFSG